MSFAPQRPAPWFIVCYLKWGRIDGVEKCGGKLWVVLDKALLAVMHNEVFQCWKLVRLRETVPTLAAEDADVLQGAEPAKEG